MEQLLYYETSAFFSDSLSQENQKKARPLIWIWLVEEKNNNLPMLFLALRNQGPNKTIQFQTTKQRERWEFMSVTAWTQKELRF